MTHTVPSVLFIESSSGDNERKSIKLAILLFHGESEDSGFVIQAHDECWVIAYRRENLYVKLEVWLGRCTARQRWSSVATLHLAVVLGHLV